MPDAAAARSEKPEVGRYRDVTPPARIQRFVSGPIVGADVLVPEESGPDYAAHIPPPPIRFKASDRSTTAILVAMELRHLLGGTTAIAGSGEVPGAIRNV